MLGWTIILGSIQQLGLVIDWYLGSVHTFVNIQKALSTNITE